MQQGSTGRAPVCPACRALDHLAATASGLHWARPAAAAAAWRARPATTCPHLVAPRMRSSRWSSLRSWWWLPLPLLMISTPASARSMCGACARGRGQAGDGGGRRGLKPGQPTRAAAAAAAEQSWWKRRGGPGRRSAGAGAGAPALRLHTARRTPCPAAACPPTCGVNSSSHVSAATVASWNASTASPKGTDSWPPSACSAGGSVCSSTCGVGWGRGYGWCGGWWRLRVGVVTRRGRRW
jgi:hypothetical protein